MERRYRQREMTHFSQDSQGNSDSLSSRDLQNTGGFTEKASNWLIGSGYRTDEEAAAYSGYVKTGSELFGQEQFIGDLARKGELQTGPGYLMADLVGVTSSAGKLFSGARTLLTLEKEMALFVERRGIGALKEFEVGTYRELNAIRKKFGTEAAFDLDHIPSQAALKLAYAEKVGTKLTTDQVKMVEQEGVAIAMRKTMHQASRTYAGRNSVFKLVDSANLHTAIKADLNVYIANATNAGVPKSTIMQTVTQVIYRNRQAGLIK